MKLTRSILPALLLAASAPALAGHPTQARQHVAPAPHGTVEVVNRAGTTLTVYVEGNAPRTLVSGATAWFGTRAGEVTVRATYRQFGQEHTLDSSRRMVHPRATVTQTFFPEDTARVLVENASPFPAELRADGRPIATLQPHEQRVIALPAHQTTLTLTANGRVLDTRRMSLRAYDEPRVRFEMPASGELLVVNPLPIPIELVCDRGLVRTVEPYGRTVYDQVPVGTFHLTARRLTDERIDDQVTRIDPWTQNTWRVDPPRDGLVTVDNDHWLPVRVTVDGTPMSSLAPEADSHLLLSVGWHRIVARDVDGRTIADTWIEVDAFDTTRVDVGSERGGPVGSRDDRYTTDAWSGHDGHDHPATASCTVPHR